MEWAVSNLVSQDWPADNLMIQSNAQKRLSSLAATLKKENRGQESDALEAARVERREIRLPRDVAADRQELLVFNIPAPAPRLGTSWIPAADTAHAVRHE